MFLVLHFLFSSLQQEENRVIKGTIKQLIVHSPVWIGVQQKVSLNSRFQSVKFIWVPCLHMYMYKYWSDFSLTHPLNLNNFTLSLNRKKKVKTIIITLVTSYITRCEREGVSYPQEWTLSTFSHFNFTHFSLL